MTRTRDREGTLGFGRGLTRRDALALLGALGVGSVVACGGTSSSNAVEDDSPAPTPAPGSTTPTPRPTASPDDVSCVVTPAETEGPFFVDERLERRDISEGLPGSPLAVVFRVLRVDGARCTPLAGAQVDVWHASAAGEYSDVGSTLGQTFLRGHQVTGEDGRVEFTTVYPGWYPGRTVHVHFKVRTFDASGDAAFEFTSQLYFDDAVTDAVHALAPYDARGARDTTNADDGIYNGSGTDGSPRGEALAFALAPASGGSGWVASFAIGLALAA